MSQEKKGGAGALVASLGCGLFAAIGALLLVLAIGGGVAAWMLWPAELEVPVAADSELAAPVEEQPAETEAPPQDTGSAPAETKETDAPPEAKPPAPTPRAPSAPAPPEDDGEIKIITDPPAISISVDDTPRGLTPLKIALDPGTHKVTLTYDKAVESFVINVDGTNKRWCYKASKKKITESDC